MKTPIDKLRPATRRTTQQHLIYEQMEAADDFVMQSSVDIYRMISRLIGSKVISATLGKTLEVIATHAKDQVCFASNQSLANACGVDSTVTISRHIRTLRDLGFVTTKDSPNCKRSSGFGLSIRILHVRYPELMDQIRSYEDERREKAIARQQYRNAYKRMMAMIEDKDFSEFHDLMLAQWEAAKDTISVVKDKTSGHYRVALAILDKTFESIFKRLNSRKTTCKDSDNAIHLPITTESPSVSCNGEVSSAKAEHSNSQIAADRGEVALEKKPEGEIRDNKSKIGEAETPNLTLGMLMQACPTAKEWLPDRVENWNDLARQTDIMGRLCGVHTSAIEEARSTVGRVQTAAMLAIVLEKSSHEDAQYPIKNPGGYIRGMIGKAKAGELHLERTVFGLLQYHSSAA